MTSLLSLSVRVYAQQFFYDKFIFKKFKHTIQAYNTPLANVLLAFTLTSFLC